MQRIFQTGHPHPQQKPQKRPLPLKLIGWVFFLWATLGWLRFFTAITERSLIIRQIGIARHAYLLFAGLTWGLVGLPVLWGLFSKAAWAPTALIFAGLFYPLFYWLERLLLWQDPNAHRNWPLMLLLTLVWAALVLWGLCSAQHRKFFIKRPTTTKEL